MRALVLSLLLAMPAAAAPKAVVAELGKKFTLRKLQRADFKGTNASIVITGFVNSPCPKGARCVWSGQAVSFELTVAGATVPVAGSGFDVKVLGSDYKTRADLIAYRSKDPGAHGPQAP